MRWEASCSGTKRMEIWGGGAVEVGGGWLGGWMVGWLLLGCELRLFGCGRPAEHDQPEPNPTNRNQHTLPTAVRGMTLNRVGPKR
jgi:hypothetical protein